MVDEDLIQQANGLKVFYPPDHPYTPIIEDLIAGAESGEMTLEKRLEVINARDGMDQTSNVYRITGRLLAAVG